MAVVVSIARGPGASCPFKTIGAAEGPVTTGERGAGYCLSAVEKGSRLYVRYMQGEAAYVWSGHHGRRIDDART